MKTLGGTVAALAAALLGGSAAHAAPIYDVEAQPPPFVLADRFASPRIINVDLGMLSPETTDVAWRLDAHWGWTNRAGLGVYAALGLTHVTDTRLRWSDIVPGSVRMTPLEGRTASSALEVGGQAGLQRRFDLPITLHVGLVVPIGASPTEGVNFLANGLTAEMRVSDAERFTWDAWWVRMGASTNGRLGLFVYQADLSASVGFPNEDYIERINPAGHLNLAAGLEVERRYTFGAELASLVIFDGTPNWVHEFALSTRVRFSRTSLHLAWLLPFDASQTFGHAFVLGLARVY